MQFVADVMLGRLAKRLRLRGFDVLYDRTFDDNEIIRLSLEQHRLILTRDRGLAERPLASNHLFIESDLLQDQLGQVLSRFPVTRSSLALTRCSCCNAQLIALDRTEARDLVPPYVYETNESFTRCAGCGRIYWTGTHVRNMGLEENRKARRKPHK